MEHIAERIVADETTSDDQELARYRTEASAYNLFSRIERELEQLHRRGDSRRTVHPDTGQLALIQTFTGPDVRANIMHARTPENDCYCVEISIKGDSNRVSELIRRIDQVLEPV